MNYYEVAPIQIIRAGSATFTYASDNELSIGQLVIIEVGKKKLSGIVMRKTTKPTYPTKPILELIEQTPLPAQLVELALWISSYYVTPLATTLQTILPRGLQKNRRKTIQEPLLPKRSRTKIVFNKEQQLALDTLVVHKDGTFLLEGITGSGKTEVYIEVAKRAIQQNTSVILLVPEIALTSQLIAEFSHHFSDVIVTHSKLTESARHQIWQDILVSDKPQIIIGPRSALFMPLKNIGAIIIDEAHEPSFKQEQSPRYSALRVATMLGRFHKAKVIFGSATPSVGDRYLAEKSNRPILKLTKLARKDSLPPTVTLVDMTKRENLSNHRYLSKQLVQQIATTLEQGKQVLIFHNRRGSTSTTLCDNCGWTAECPRCFLPLTLHSDQHLLRCHVCDHKADIPTSCPVCGGVDIIHKGVGTKLIESELRALFKSATIARFDADSANDETVNALYNELYNGSIDIIIGTQTIAKGLDLPHLRTVGVIQADSGLALPDFSSSERTFQ
ncbi:MAG TPA: primosomal protein N', partial [Candidatus Saccharimonadales bacterium]|nr:primosomal protein N' [Candidatus Saccharimonadales bacterium]